MTEQKPPPKKSELIEVRVTYETKREFLAACQRAGRTASDVVREGIERFVAAGAAERFPVAEEAGKPADVIAFIPRPMRKKRYLAAGVGAAGLALFAALPSAAAPDLTSIFRQMDTNQDGSLSADEFAASKGEVVMVRAMKSLPKGQVFLHAPKEGEAVMTYNLPKDPGATDIQRQTARHQTFDPNDPPTLAMIRRGQFVNVDADKDGKVGLEEFVASRKAALAAGFKRLDGDGDGALSAEEYAKLNERVLTWPADMDTRFGTTVQVGPILSEPAVAAEFTRLDANRDGKLTAEEYLPE